MNVQLSRYWLSIILVTWVIWPAQAALSATEAQGSHKSMSGVVIKKGNTLAVKTPDGTTFQTNENAARRKGEEPFKEGDQVTVVVDENNTVIDMHLQGEEGKHTFVTGKLVHLGQMQKEVKLQTPQGEKVFPLAKQEVKTKGIAEGTEVTVELNEAGSVIDLHRADAGKSKH